MRVGFWGGFFEVLGVWRERGGERNMERRIRGWGRGMRNFEYERMERGEDEIACHKLQRRDRFEA